MDLFYTRTSSGIHYNEERLPFQEDATAAAIDTLLDQVDERELSYFFKAATELRCEILNLQWYGKVNHDALYRILVKMQEAWPSDSKIQQFVHTNLRRLDFEARNKCSLALDRVECFMSALGNAIARVKISTQERHVSLCLRARLQDRLSTQTLDTLCRAIRGDDVATLSGLLPELPHTDRTHRRETYSALALYCMLHESYRCLAQLNGNSSGDDRIVQQLVTKTGRERLACTTDASDAWLNNNEDSFDIFRNMLRWTSPPRDYEVWEKDSFGRLPLHYAAAYGLATICTFLLDHMRTTERARRSPIATETGDDVIRDSQGHTPLHLAIVGKHLSTTKVLLAMHNEQRNSDSLGDDQRFITRYGELLNIAMSSDSHELVDCLLDAATDISYRNVRGETILFIASRSGHERWVRRLLSISDYGKMHLNTVEWSHGRNPLLIASMQGNLSIVELLISAGADCNVRDRLGWSALELAAYRGHMAVMNLLVQAQSGITTNAGSCEAKDSNILSLPSLGALRKDKSSIAVAAHLGKDEKASHKTTVILNLGSLDTRRSSPAVDLGQYISFDSSLPGYLTSFSLAISVMGAKGSYHTGRLPVLDDMANLPCIFSLDDQRELKVRIEVFKEDRLTGCGIALLDNLKNGLGSQRESLVRDFAIPVLEDGSSRFIGTVTITAIVVTPFQPSTTVRPTATDIWKNPSSPYLVGHRGAPIVV